MQIRLTRSAEEDLARGFEFYERQKQSLGTYFLDNLYADIDSLMLYAGIHAKPVGRFHRVLSKRFPFAIYYEVKNDIVTVVAILDCRQNPGTIRTRLF
jgi:plasmid stabilization system protein ParE